MRSGIIRVGPKCSKSSFIMVICLFGTDSRVAKFAYVSRLQLKHKASGFACCGCCRYLKILQFTMDIIFVGDRYPQ